MSAPSLALLALALLRPLLRDALDGGDDGGGFHDRTTTADLPRSRYSTRGQATCSTKITGSSVSTFARDRMVSRLMPKPPSSRKGLRMPGDQLTPVTRRRSSFALSPRQPNAVSTRRESVVVVVGDLAVIEALHLAAGGGEASLKVLAADDAELSRLHRLGVLLHGRQQLPARLGIDLPIDDEAAQRRAREPDRVEHCLLLRGAAQAAELGHELAHRPVAAIVGVVGDVGGDQALEPLRVVPVRAGRVGRSPLRPLGGGRRDLDPALAEPVDASASGAGSARCSHRQFVKNDAFASFRIEHAESGHSDPDLGPGFYRVPHHLALDDRRLADPVDPEDDPCRSPCAAISILPHLLVQHERHGDDGLQRVALRAARRRDVGFPGGDPDGEVEDALDRRWPGCRGRCRGS